MPGDASTRSYARLLRGDGTVILMNSPRRPDGPAIYDGKSYSAAVHLAEDVKPFVAIANGLRERGFSAPAIRHADLDQGFLITEDFGSDGVVEGDPPQPIAERYEAATDMLAALHRERLPEILPLTPQQTYAIPVFDIDALAGRGRVDARMVSARSRRRAELRIARRIRRDVASICWPSPRRRARTWVMRDFHSPNMIWLGERAGHRAGRHHRLPGRCAGACRLRPGVAVAGRADRRPRAARTRAVDPLHQGAAHGRREFRCRPVSPSSTPSCRRSETRACSAPLRGSTGATASRNICVTSRGSGPISTARWPTRRWRGFREWYAANVPPPVA